MDATIVKLIVWVLVGMLAGSLTGLVVTGKKEGFGKLANLGIGMAGALIGGFLFNILEINLGLADISINLHDLVAAFVGSLVFLGLLTFGRRWYRKRSG